MPESRDGLSIDAHLRVMDLQDLTPDTFIRDFVFLIGLRRGAHGHLLQLLVATRVRALLAGEWIGQFLLLRGRRDTALDLVMLG